MMVMAEDKASVHYAENKPYVAGQCSFCHEYKKDLFDHKEVYLLDVLAWLLLSSNIIQWNSHLILIKARHSLFNICC
jgi:thioredoxin-related protein